MFNCYNLIFSMDGEWIGNNYLPGNFEYAALIEKSEAKMKTNNYKQILEKNNT